MNSQKPADQPTATDAERGEQSQSGFANADDKRNPVKPNSEGGHAEGDDTSPRDKHPEPKIDESRNN